MIAFTIGNTKSYEEAFRNHPNDAFKLGKTDDYEGGFIWKTAAEAEDFIRSPAFLKIDWGDGRPRLPEDFSVFRVFLANGYEDISAVPNEDGAHYLLVNSRFDR